MTGSGINRKIKYAIVTGIIFQVVFTQNIFSQETVRDYSKSPQM